VDLELRDSGGVEVDIKSKVDFMYGTANRELVHAVLDKLGIGHAHVSLEDTGALPFVIAGRIEAAAHRAGVKGHRYVTESGPSFARPSPRDAWRRSRLYLPGNEPKFMLSARLYEPDSIILDLEDSVTPAEKDAALILVRNALRTVDFGTCERMVRINQLPRGIDDIAPVVEAGANLLLVPKCEDGDEVRAVANRAAQAAEDCGKDVWLMPIIETCRGMFNALEIARASNRVVALTWGLEDYLADLGAVKTATGHETLWARAQVVNAARAAGVQPIDTVFGDVDDLAALADSCRAARELGFEGKGCIHPRQVAVVNESFSPGPEEVERARRIVLAHRDAEARGLGAVCLGSKMVDAPVVKRALRTIELAVACGCLSPGWDRTDGSQGDAR
jgi:citrate lyase subunit beta/citryl-CoA lyase